MNYLVHLYLSDATPMCLIGNLMGDFIKGPIGAKWPEEIAHGLRQHRKVDVFAHNHIAHQKSRRRLNARYGHCRSIMVDIFYDHILAKDWDLFCRQPLEDFTRSVYQNLENHFYLLPKEFKAVARRMIDQDWLSSYRQTSVIDEVLKRLSSRLSKPNAMAEGLEALLDNYQALREDCHKFLYDAHRFFDREPTD